MSKYIDGFVLPVKKDKLDAYRALAERAGAIWEEHGALEYVESICDDLDAKGMVSFPALANASDDEIVVFSWIVYESREHRDQVNQKVFTDPRMSSMCGSDAMPFDCSRLAYGGFQSIVEYSNAAKV